MALLDVDIVTRLREFRVDLSLAVEAEVMALVGPSGAGKTTVLRAIAGLRRPDSGRIACDGEVWLEHGGGTRPIDLPPERRSVGYVPQHQALFPHLTVARNIAFSGADAGTVDSLIDRLGLRALAGERPARLSGGERQRVALARALARRPKVLLLDEPLASLDAHTRRVVRHELADELRRLAIPTLLVTHDPADAAALADRVAVIVAGRLRQLARPAELVAAPADRFVVALTGGTVLRGRLAGDRPVVDPAGDVELAVYPWDLDVRRGPGPPGTPSGTVAGVAYEGGRLRVRVDGWVGEADAGLGLEVGDEVHGVVRHARPLPRDPDRG